MMIAQSAKIYFKKYLFYSHKIKPEVLKINFESISFQQWRMCN